MKFRNDRKFRGFSPQEVEKGRKSRDLPYLVEFSVLLRKCGLFDDAIRIALEVVDFSSPDKMARSLGNLAYIYFDAERFREASDTTLKIFQLFWKTNTLPEDMLEFISIFAVRMALASEKNLKAMLGMISGMNQGNRWPPHERVYLHFWLAQIHFQLEKYGEAVQSVDRALYFAKQSEKPSQRVVDCHVLRASARFRDRYSQGKPSREAAKERLVEVEELRGRFPSNEEVLVLYAEFLRKAGLLERAIEQTKVPTKLFPERKAVIRSKALLQLGKHQKALEAILLYRRQYARQKPLSLRLSLQALFLWKAFDTHRISVERAQQVLAAEAVSLVLAKGDGFVASIPTTQRRDFLNALEIAKTLAYERKPDWLSKNI